MAGGVLALDLATRSGWAAADAIAVDAWPEGIPGAEVGPFEGVHYGSHRLAGPDMDEGYVFDKLFKWLNTLIDLQQPDSIVYEAPLPVQRNPKTAKRLIGLVTIADLVAHQRKCRIWMMDVPTVRKTFAGSGRADKDKIMAVCKQRGWTPKDHDASDALAVLDASIRMLARMQKQRAA